MRIAIIGSKDLAKQIAYYCQSCTLHEVVGYFDDFEPAGRNHDGQMILGKVDQAELLYQKNLFDGVVMAIGYNHFAIRSTLFEKLHTKIPFVNVIHPSAYIDPSVQLGTGVVVFPRVVVDCGVQLGNNILLNTGSVIAHDTKIGDHTFVAPGANLAGFIQVGKSCFIGVGAAVIQNIKFCDGVFVAAGAVVVNHLLEPGLYKGVPAKKSVGH